MEAQSHGSEVRRLHVVYFLSRKGFVEHPHLLRIHHLSNNGVRLRDIKRWLGELRGENMPESFAWSYKRKYKTGYVWQDLLDDDLVTPISDNEFVLKGSEISSTTNTTAKNNIENQSRSSETSSIYVPTKTSSEIEEYSSPTFGSETSTLTDEHSDKIIANKNDEKRISKVKTTASSSNKSKIFRNLITCGAVDTNDSALLVKNKGKSCSNSKSCDEAKDSTTKKVHFNEQNIGPRAAYKPSLNQPNCSQCGKPFKLEKLHAHMKQCKGMKSSAKLASFNPAIFTNNADINSRISTKLFENEGSLSDYLLTH